MGDHKVLESMMKGLGLCQIVMGWIWNWIA